MTIDEQTKESLKKLRRAAGITQEEMAERLGIQRSTYRNIENGSTRLVNARMDMIARTLNVRPAELMGYDFDSLAAGQLSDVENEYEKEMVSLRSENSRLEESLNALRAENETLKADIAFFRDMTKWLRSELDRRDRSDT